MSAFSDALPTKVSAPEGGSFTFPLDVPDAQKYDWITWIFENATIAEIKQNRPRPEYYRDRLQMNDQTRSLTIKDVKSTDAGLYKLQVVGQNQNLKIRAYRLTVSSKY